jgi:ATP-dependent DNA ligase
MPSIFYRYIGEGGTPGSRQQSNHAVMISLHVRFYRPVNRKAAQIPTCGLSSTRIQLDMARRASAKPKPDIAEGAVPAEELKQEFPPIALPIQPPFPPMEAKSVAELPEGSNWAYEPKWDGFRCLAFRKGSEVLLQSKAGQPLGRYFPEMVAALAQLKAKQFVLDGEIVILRDGRLSFDDLLLRIHPAESRIRKLSQQTPASYLVFDQLVDEKGKSLIELPLSERRERLEELFRQFGSHSSQQRLSGAPEQAGTHPGKPGASAAPAHGTSPSGAPQIRLSPSVRDYETARHWLTNLAASGFDGVVAKQLDCPYASGERRAMQKIKRIRTADCVVGGFRYASKGGEVGSLLLGLYDENGLLNHVGFTSSFAAEERKKLKAVLKPYMGGSGFTGHAPGGPSRWSTERSGEWERLDPKLVCEVRYDHFSGGRFRHGTKFLRWRPDKDPKSCEYEQLANRGGVGNVEKILAG